MTRRVLVILHRWVGLSIAAFLVVSGMTGAVISWDHPLDRWLNPRLYAAVAPGKALPSLELAALVERRDPRVRVTAVPLAPEAGGTLELGVEPRVDPATGRAHALDHNELFLDPATGAELGRREWGRSWPISRETAIPFLYKLHYSLHVPEMWGIPQWGVWLMGGVALLWTADCLVGFMLSLPMRRRAAPDLPDDAGRQPGRGWWARWRPAWRVRLTGGAYRATFDVHRASGLWCWGLLFVLAFTGFSMNLYREVFLPVVSTLSAVTPTPSDVRAPHDRDHPVEPREGFTEVLRRAGADGAARGIADPPGSVFYSPSFGYYTVRFFRPGEEDGPAGAAPPELYYDGLTGEAIGARLPWRGTAADIVLQAQFPLHSGRILGITGRIVVSLMGLVVSALSVTGVAIWWRKRAARVRRGRLAASARRHAAAE